MVRKVLDRPEVWQIDVALPQNPLRSLNVYVLRSQGRDLVIDTGFRRPECRAALMEGLALLEVDFARTSLFLTHLHSDHIGLAGEFAARGCPIYMGGVDYDYFCAVQAGEVHPALEDLYRREGFPEELLARQAEENQGRKYAPEAAFPAVKVKDGTKLRLGDTELLCIHTPGHTPGHTVLYLPEQQVLFSGDHILFDVTPNIGVWKDVPKSLADYLESLEKVGRLPIRRTLPAHRAGEGDAAARIAALRDHHRRRLGEIYAAVARTPGLDAYTIAGRIGWSARGRPWSEFPPHQKWFAMGETLAHLSYLCDAGRVERQAVGGGFRYTAAGR